MNIRIAVFNAFLLISCINENVIRFESPQPAGQKDEKSIPGKIRGTYFNPHDSSELIVGPQFIVRKWSITLSSPLSGLDSLDRIKFQRDTAFSEMTGNEKTDYSVRKDSIYISQRNSDTTFDFMKGDILRKFKGYYFISHQVSDRNWRVTKLARIRKGITLGYVTTPKDLENLRQLTESSSDTVYNFNPTRKQFRKFIKESGFSEEDIFIRKE